MSSGFCDTGGVGCIIVNIKQEWLRYFIIIMLLFPGFHREQTFFQLYSYKNN